MIPPIRAGCLMLAVTTSACGDEPPPAPSGATAPPAAASVSGDAPSAARGKSAGIRFEGTELHLGSLPPVAFHGFASQGFLATSDYNYLGGKTTDGSFEFSEFAVNAAVTPFNRTRVSAQAFCFDLGNVGNYDVALDYGMVDYSFCNEFGLRGGRIRRPSGIYNHIQDIDLARTYALLPQAVYDARWRDWGGSVDGGAAYGSVDLGKVGSASYEAFGGMVNLSQEGGIARQFQNMTLGVGSDRVVNDFPMFGLQCWWSPPVQGLRMGAMVGKALGLTGDWTFHHPLAGAIPGRMEVDALLQQYSLEYVWKGWTFQAEWLQKDNAFDSKVGPLKGSYLVNEQYHTHPAGWYVGAAYRFNKWLEAGGYYSEAYERNAKIQVDSDKYQKDVALSLRFDPKPWWIIKLEGHYLEGTGLVRDDALNPQRNEDGWWMVAIKTTVSF
jgi:hypothetical protein